MVWTTPACSGPRLVRQESSDAVARAARDYDQTLRQVRTMPGFERYLDTTPYPELASAATSGTIVIVNVSQYGGAAIVATPGADHPRVVNLPRLDLETAADRAAQLTRMIEQFRGQRPPSWTGKKAVTRSWTSSAGSGTRSQNQSLQISQPHRQHSGKPVHRTATRRGSGGALPDRWCHSHCTPPATTPVTAPRNIGRRDGA